jgi:hypothetical protein
MAKQSAAEYLEARNPEVSVILAELAESAGAVARSWHLAVEIARRDPDRAETHLIDAEIRLNHHVRLELSDSLRRVRRGIELLSRQLPDPEE